MSHSPGISPMDTKQVHHAAEDCASPTSYLGLNRNVSPRSTPKSVSYAPYAETISPLILGQQKSVEDLSLLLGSGRSPRRPPVRGPNSRRLSGKPSPALKPMSPPTTAYDGTVSSAIFDDRDVTDKQEEHHRFDALVDQVSSWIKDKRERRHKRKSGKPQRETGQIEHDTPQSQGSDAIQPKQRRGSDSSQESLDLDKLERIIRQNLSMRRTSLHRGSITALRSKTSMRRLLRKQSTASESDFLENDFVVPTCDAVLDNSKTLAYTGGASDFSDDSGGEDLTRVPSYRDNEAWARFKFEIVRLTHTLRLKGWKRVALETSSAIDVVRLSGALTNCVYVVSPPSDLPLQKEDENGNVVSISRPTPKLLLRIYGAQVDHLIDRESELAILRRLARKHIGPRLLGTFANGRFEEYLHAKPLTRDELRDPGTSRQIAKRMRELHEGVELLDQERAAGAFVWRNWDKWLHRVERIVTWMDEQVRALKPGERPMGPRAWLRRGYICGVPWEQFCDVVQKYREWLKSQYGGSEGVRQHLVFAHNDTQYGNILRQIPTGDSPLLLPANTHKQLVVIDFEYASANTPGLEFANHFTEWCYNYHDQRKPYACNTNGYPTTDEQDRFIRAYVQHRPEFNVNTPKMTPVNPSMLPSPAATLSPGELTKRPTTSISDFMLDARTPQMGPLSGPPQDLAQKTAEDTEVERLRQETRIWRLANTAQWVAWGLVQAKVAGMPTFEDEKTSTETIEDDTAEDTEPEDLLGERAEEFKALAREQLHDVQEEEQEFDYLGYAQHRAMFFWGDAIQMGFIKAQELPEETRSKVKTVPY